MYVYISCWLKSLDKNQEEIGELEIGEILSEKNIYIYRYIRDRG